MCFAVNKVVFGADMVGFGFDGLLAVDRVGELPL